MLYFFSCVGVGGCLGFADTLRPSLAGQRTAIPTGALTQRDQTMGMGLGV